MTNITVDLYTIIQSELQKKGFNEFENNGKWTFFNPNYQFMQKIMSYDNDVKQIVNNLFFLGNKLPNEKIDDTFKKTFLNKFLRREINRQTIEDFSMQVVYTFLSNLDYIIHVYDINDFLMNKKIMDSKSEGTNNSTSKDDVINDTRNLHSDLPQTEINLDVDNTVLDYGTTNTISRNKDKRNSESKSDNQSNSNNISVEFNLDNLVRINGMLESVFIDFDKNCFIQAF